MNEEKFFEGVAALKLMAKKEIGQNFLIDPRAAERIVNSLEAKEGEKILEIGCGAGSLTYFLSSLPCHVDAIDIDEGMLTKVQGDFEGIDNLHIQYGNAAKWDYSSYDKIIGNLPYYITTLLIENCLLGASKASKFVFMVQKEAATRLLAGPGTKDYGPLNVYLALSGKLKRQFNVGRNSFSPIPHVDSAVLSIDLDQNRDKEFLKQVYRFASSMFSKRRKTILNNLKSYLHDEQKALDALDKAKIEKNRRPDAITPAEYSSLFSSLIEVK